VGAEQERRAAGRAHARAVVVMILGMIGASRSERRRHRELVDGELDGHVRGAARAVGIGPDPAAAGRASPDRRGCEGRGRLPKLREGSEHGEAGPERWTTPMMRRCGEMEVGEGSCFYTGRDRGGLRFDRANVIRRMGWRGKRRGRRFLSKLACGPERLTAGGRSVAGEKREADDVRDHR
jgi:hypothetical protein